MTSRRLEHSYISTLAIALLALSPDLVLATALILLQPRILADLRSTPTVLEVSFGLSNAAYAFGALLAGDLTQRFRQRDLFFVCEGSFVIASLCCAFTTNVDLFVAARVVQGLVTGMLLVVALPPLIRRFGPERLPFTAGAVNIGFFGAITVGPLVGGVFTAGHTWRWLFAAVALLGAIGFALGWVTLPSQEPADRGMRVDRSALTLGLLATVLPFFGASELMSVSFSSPVFWAPVAIGLACFVALLVSEYCKKDPLAPVKLITQTRAVVGTLAAMLGGAVFVALLELTLAFLTEIHRWSPRTTGLLFWPQVVGTIIAAAALWWAVRTRLLSTLVLVGMVVLLVGGIVVTTLGAHPSVAIIFLIAALLGLGAGATVAPGLFLAGLSVPSNILGRTFALVELVRSEADFLLAPVLLEIFRSRAASAGPVAALHHAVWITIAIGGAGTVVGLALYLTGARPVPAQLEQWLQGTGTALPTERLGSAVHRRQS
jgi:MFS family permease